MATEFIAARTDGVHGLLCLGGCAHDLCRGSYDLWRKL
jgi:hypothetical protein